MPVVLSFLRLAAGRPCHTGRENPDCPDSGVAPANQTKERSVHELFTGDSCQEGVDSARGVTAIVAIVCAIVKLQGCSHTRRWGFELQLLQIAALWCCQTKGVAAIYRDGGKIMEEDLLVNFWACEPVVKLWCSQSKSCCILSASLEYQSSFAVVRSQNGIFQRVVELSRSKRCFQ